MNNLSSYEAMEVSVDVSSARFAAVAAASDAAAAAATAAPAGQQRLLRGLVWDESSTLSQAFVTISIF